MYIRRVTFVCCTITTQTIRPVRKGVQHSPSGIRIHVLPTACYMSGVTEITICVHHTRGFRILPTPHALLRVRACITMRMTPFRGIIRI